MRVTPTKHRYFGGACEGDPHQTSLFTALGASERSKHRYLPHLVLLSAQNRCSSPLGGLMSAQNCCSSLLRSHRSAQNCCSSLLESHRSARNRCSSLLEGQKSTSKVLLKLASRLQWPSKSLFKYHCSKSLFEEAGLCAALPCSPLLLLYLPPCMDMHG